MWWAALLVHWRTYRTQLILSTAVTLSPVPAHLPLGWASRNTYPTLQPGLNPMETCMEGSLKHLSHGRQLCTSAVCESLAKCAEQPRLGPQAVAGPCSIPSRHQPASQQLSASFSMPVCKAHRSRDENCTLMNKCNWNSVHSYLGRKKIVSVIKMHRGKRSSLYRHIMLRSTHPDKGLCL